MNKKHVLITGGNKGIGLETTKLMLNAGFFVTIIARDFSKMEKFNHCNCIEFDLRHTEKIEDLISTIEPIDVLINNAAMMNTYAYNDYPENKKNDLIKLNLEAPVELITFCAKNMLLKNQGRIVNVASIAGQIGHPDLWYGISKAGMINMTKSFAQKLGKHGIIVNAVAPGIVVTDMINSIPEFRQASFLKRVHSERFATAKEIAQTILWLATDSPEYINGTCIDINDGAFPR